MAARRDLARSTAAVAGAASAAAAEVETALAVPPDRHGAAFFDVDNTVMQGASIFHFARGLAARRMFHLSDVARFTWQQLVFRVGGRERHGHMTQVREKALSLAAGLEVDALVATAEEVYDELMADRIWSGTRALAQQHLDAGQRVWLVTATPVELATIIARRLGLTGALGTVSEVVGGRYTGRLVGDVLHGEAKAAAVRALAEREGLDLASCSAYSDSANDLPLLSLVGYPCAVNPDTRLRAEARARGWPVRDYRTGRKAAKVGVPATLGAAALTGGTVVALRLTRRRHAR